jgi:AcrR family transcriptional regulator
MQIETVEAIAAYLKVNPKTITRWYGKKEENGFPANKMPNGKGREKIYGDGVELTRWHDNRREVQVVERIKHG